MQSGRDLKLKRVALDVTSGALAAQVGVPSSQISRWESSRLVTDSAAKRYLAALATFGTIPTIDVGVPEAEPPLALEGPVPA